MLQPDMFDWHLCENRLIELISKPKPGFSDSVSIEHSQHPPKTQKTLINNAHPNTESGAGCSSSNRRLTHTRSSGPLPSFHRSPIDAGSGCWSRAGRSSTFITDSGGVWLRGCCCCCLILRSPSAVHYTTIEFALRSIRLCRCKTVARLLSTHIALSADGAH